MREFYNRSYMKIMDFLGAVDAEAATFSDLKATGGSPVAVSAHDAAMARVEETARACEEEDMINCGTAVAAVTALRESRRAELEGRVAEAERQLKIATANVGIIQVHLKNFVIPNL